MGKSKSWLVTFNLVLFAIAIGAPNLLGTRLRGVIFTAWLFGISYILGFLALCLAVWIAFSQQFSLPARLGNLALSVTTLVICGYFSFM